MPKLPCLACLATLLLMVAKPQTEMFSKYKSIEAYEIRPGVFAMPRYAEDGQLCELGVEKRSYSHGTIRIGESFSHQEIDQIADEFAPLTERGAKLKGIAGGGMTLSGQTYSNDAVYENVTISSYGGISHDTDRKPGLTSTGEVAFTIQWTKRTCK